jgi:hypothetical protein
MLTDEALHGLRAESVDGHPYDDQALRLKGLVELFQRGPLLRT